MVNKNSAKGFRLRISWLFTLVFFSNMAFAEAINTNSSGVVLNGYDVVAYFSGEAKPGNRSNVHTTEHGTMWFASNENREKFIANPERYLPAFSGYCAFGVRMGRKLPIDPESFVVHNETLYVLLNRATRRMFLDDLDRNLEIAHRLWPQVQHRPLED
ncbi:MAG: hypothetical protein ACI8P9_001258 [Parasphingorhabdus sp.]|jgi:hypothetical protein